MAYLSSFKDDLQKDIQAKRIKEKAIAEGASAVFSLSEADQQFPGSAVISGVSHDEYISALIGYAYNKEAKTIVSWEIKWLDHPAKNVLLESIFDRTS